VAGERPDPETVELVLMLVDGRNRLEACKRAKFKPATVTLNGEDPTAFVLSANIHRRHMNKEPASYGGGVYQRHCNYCRRLARQSLV
jgi:hypothetical protein